MKDNLVPLVLVFGLVFGLVLLFPGQLPATETSDETEATGTQVVMMEALRYTAELAEKLVAPQPWLSIPYGTGKAELGGPQQDLLHLCHGCPPAFRPGADETIMVLDALNHELKSFSRKGLLRALPLTLPGSPEGRHVSDFAAAPQDGFYLFAPNVGKVFQINGEGQMVNEVEGLFDATAINSDHAGNLLVSRFDGLFRFGPNAVLLEKYDALPGLSVYVDLENRPYGLSMTDVSATLYRVDHASPSQSVDLLTYPLNLPSNTKAHFAKADILGVDAAQNLYLEFVACDDDGVVYLQQMLRVSPKGDVLSSLDFKVHPVFAPSLPRSRIAMPDGRVLGFQDSDSDHQFHVYSIP